MKYIDEFRDKNIVQGLAKKIKQLAPARKINIMEVCGTHTQNFLRFGLDKLLPKNVQLIAGPGCPVCVSTQEYVDQAINCAKYKDTLVVTFGDMLRLPGRRSSLEKERARGAAVVLAYSPLDAIAAAQKNPKKKVVFLGIGFETTIPTVALSILRAKKLGLRNIFFLSSFKLIPPAMGHLLKEAKADISGFLCPGHVSAIIGTKSYEFIPKEYKIGCCVAGFEPVDILQGLYLLLRQIKNAKALVENEYARVVAYEGNLKAQEIISKVFRVCAANWRGLGKIPKSGLKIRDEFSRFDAEIFFPIDYLPRNLRPETRNCKCPDILKGVLRPLDCPLFLKICNPSSPYGPCMVSNEGACNAYYRYHN